VSWALAGVLEGFYGRPWSWDERLEVARRCAAGGMRHYVWAPKDDPLHREAWRDPWPEEHLDGFRRLCDDRSFEVALGISPGLSMDYRDPGERDALLAKVAPVVELGATWVVLAVDDIPPRPGLGEEHAELTAWLHGQLVGRARLTMVPTEYVGARPTDYLRALADGVPDEVPIGWTGASVVNDQITVAEAEERGAVLGGRKPMVWDNVPVNDGMMGDRLFLGPLRGRDPGLAGWCSGWLANAGVQPRASLPSLVSTAAWLRGDDPEEAWGAFVDERGWRVFAEACDGRVPRQLVAALEAEAGGPGWTGSAGPLARWLLAAAEVRAAGLEDEAGPWLHQVRAEAGVALAALRAYLATKPSVRLDEDGRGRVAPPHPGRATRQLMAALLGTLEARRQAPTVLGARWSVQPSFGHRDDGSWVVTPAALVEDESATDALVRLALGEQRADLPGPPRVFADAEEVEVAADGSFTVPPGAVVLARSGQDATRVTAPAEPPLPDPRLG
jgi:hypothetical protein